MSKGQKQKVLGVLAVVLCLCLITVAVYFILNNQNENPEHSHEYSIEYKRDENNHWFECDCGDKREIENHTFIDGVCVCGYEEGHVHDFNETKYDENNHWFECACGEKSEVEAHIFVDNLCKCGYEKEEEGGNTVNPENPTPPTHTHSYVSEFDGTNHWKECSCGEKKEVEAHKGGSATCTKKANCSVCGVEYGVYENHNYESLNHDKNDHWYECDCGAKNDQKPHSGGSATCAKKAKCSVCSCEYGERLAHVFVGNRCECGVYEPTYYTEGLVFELDGQEYSVTGYNGSATEVVIPAIYNEKPVASIGKIAFNWCTSLTSIEIPNSVTSIGDGAFATCIRLASIEIPDSVTSIGGGPFGDCTSLTSIKVAENNPAYKSMDGNLYTKDGKTLVNYAIGKTATNFSIPSSVEIIGYRAFNNCDNLVSVEIPNGVTTIRGFAFSNCENLKNVVLPNSVTSVESDSFSQCYGMESLTLSNNLKKIGECAFQNCIKLISVVIPISVTNIGAHSFAGCENLTIYCKATRKPSGWVSFHSVKNVVWGYNG